MNVLFLMSQLPYPLDTGAKIRTFNLIKKVSKVNKITLVAFGDEQKDLDKVKALNKICNQVHIVSRGRDFSYLSILFNFFSVLPYNIKKYFSKKMVKLIQKLIKADEFDLIHCDSLQMSHNLSIIDSIPKVLTEHNVESQIIKRYFENETNLIKKGIIYYQWKKLFKYEIEICKKFDHCITVSEEDKKILENHGNINCISVVSNGVDTDYFKLLATSHQTPEESIVITGSMDWLPNSDAVEYFCRDILPLIWEDKPNLRFYVVGRNPTEAVKKLAEKDHRLVVTGIVDDVRSYVAKAKVFVVPLRIGGGSRLKILEAMSMKKAVVSTSIGAEGLGVEHGKNIILADGPESFANAVKKVFKDDELRKSLENEGEKLVKEKYDWSVVAVGLKEVWAKVKAVK